MSEFATKDFLVCMITDMQARNNKYNRENLVRKVHEIWQYLPEIPKPSGVSTNIIQDPWLTYPYDKNLITSIVHLFERAGWEITWRVTEGEITKERPYPRICFSHPFATLSVVCEFNDTISGSTCTRKVIGKEMIERDIVEFVCNDENTNQ